MIKKRSLFAILNNHVIDYPTPVNINYFRSLGALICTSLIINEKFVSFCGPGSSKMSLPIKGKPSISADIKMQQSFSGPAQQHIDPLLLKKQNNCDQLLAMFKEVVPNDRSSNQGLLDAFNECQRNVGLNAPIKEESSASVSGSKTVFSTNEFSLLDFIDLSNFYTYFGLYMGFTFFLFQLYIFLCMGKSFFIGEAFKSYFCCIRDIKLDFHLFFMLIFGGLLSIAFVFFFCILNDYVNFLQEHINYNFKYHELNKESLDLLKEEVNFLKNVQLIDHGRPPELSCAAGKSLIKDNDGVL